MVYVGLFVSFSFLFRNIIEVSRFSVLNYGFLQWLNFSFDRWAEFIELSAQKEKFAITRRIMSQENWTHLEKTSLKFVEEKSKSRYAVNFIIWQLRALFFFWQNEEQLRAFHSTKTGLWPKNSEKLLTYWKRKYDGSHTNDLGQC